MGKARILIVENEDLVAQSLNSYLARTGYEVTGTVATGEEAVDQISEVEPDLVIMDIRLGGKLSGIDAAGLIKDSSSVPIIYLTAYADPETLEKAGRTEPFGYVLKPFDGMALQATIEMALRKSEAQNELKRTKEQMSSILQSVGDGIVVTGVNGVVEYINTTATRLLQLTGPLALSKSIFKLLKIADAKSGEQVALHVDRVLVEGESVDLPNCVVSTPGGATLDVDINLEPHRDVSGAIRGIVFAFRDASQRKRIGELVDKELMTATSLHKSLLPPDGASVRNLVSSGFVVSASFGAGDVYNFFRIDDERAGFYMVDVMGHGISATSMALLLSRLLAPDPARGGRMAFLDADPGSPLEVVTRLNDLFHSSAGQTFFTICYGVFEFPTSTLKLVRAGHPYPVLLKAGLAPSEILSGGYAVGISSVFDVPAVEVALDLDDRLFIYSDGLVDCADNKSESYSKERLTRMIASTADLPLGEAVARIRRNVVEWRGKGSFDDDMTLFAIQLTATSGFKPVDEAPGPAREP